MSAITSPTSPATLLSQEEISKATGYLASTRDSLIDSVCGLSDAQWHFKPLPDCWSIAEILEHVVIVEGRVHAIVAGMAECPATKPGGVSAEMEEIIVTKVPNRSSKFQAPPIVMPTQAWGPEESLARFVQARARTVELLFESAILRGHVRPHPIFGDWDGYQWILGGAAHSARHTGQILEVKACPGYPGAGLAD